MHPRQGASRFLNAVEVAGIDAYRHKGKNCSYDPNILKYVEAIIDQNWRRKWILILYVVLHSEAINKEEDLVTALFV